MIRRSRTIPLPEPASLTNSLKICERCRLGHAGGTLCDSLPKPFHLLGGSLRAWTGSCRMGLMGLDARSSMNRLFQEYIGSGRASGPDHPAKIRSSER
jgi:hypothetical protein